MNYQKDREQFLATIANEGVSLDAARLVLRHANTIQRLATAECNGDYPCDNGERKVQPCSRCESGYVRSVLSKDGICPQCRAQDRITAILKPFNVQPVFQGDPRGCCVKLAVPSGKTDDWGREGLCVPTRDF